MAYASHCIHTTPFASQCDRTTSPEGVHTVEAAVARLLKELGVEAAEVGGEGVVGERAGGTEVEREGIGAGVGNGGQEGRRGVVGGRDKGEVGEGEVGKRVGDGKSRILKEGAGEWKIGWHGGLRGRRLMGREEEGTGEREWEVGLNKQGKKAEGGKGEGEGEGNAEGKDEGKGEGKDENEGSKVKEGGEGRGGEAMREAMPEAWRRFYEALPNVVDAEGHENMWKSPIWVSLAVNMCVRAVVDMGVCAAVGMGVCAAVGMGVCAAVGMGVCAAVGMGVCAAVGMGVCAAVGMRVCAAVGMGMCCCRDNLTDSLEGQVWLPQDRALLLQPPTALQSEGGPVALIPRNSGSRDGFYGDVGMVFRRDSDYINAGVMLWRRSSDTFKVGWYSEQQGDYHLFNHVWEQHRLNEVARWPPWRRRVLMVPFRELTGPQGAMVRHLWGGVASEEQDRVVHEALEEALGSLQTGQHIRVLH
ncbi:unnamed protein product [Closterium sp. Yama58-4]|nr:unnamed protein product [Closterium sp. Yama58-4]